MRGHEGGSTPRIPDGREAGRNVPGGRSLAPEGPHIDTTSGKPVYRPEDTRSDTTLFTVGDMRLPHTDAELAEKGYTGEALAKYRTAQITAGEKYKGVMEGIDNDVQRGKSPLSELNEVKLLAYKGLVASEMETVFGQDSRAAEEARYSFGQSADQDLLTAIEAAKYLRAVNKDPKSSE